MRRRGTAASPLGAVRWSVASFAISQAIGSLLYLPLARLLTPSDFGLFAEAGLVVTGLMLLSEMGLVQAVIRLDGDRRVLSQAAFVLSIVMGVIGAVLCVLAGPPLAAIFDEEQLRLILILMAPAVLFNALGSVPHALLARDLDFRRKTLPETVSISVGGTAALAAGLLGAGVFSLVIYWLMRTSLSSLVGWLVIGWRPAPRRPDGAVVRRILGFSVPVSGGELALSARLNADNAIAGRVLGADQLGVYTLASSAAFGPAAVIQSFFASVGYATFSRLQRHREQLRAVYLSATRLIASIAFSLFLGAVFLRQELVDVIYGPRWAEMVGPLLPLFLLQGIREVCRPGASLTLATGHSRLYMVCGIVMLPLTIIAVLIGARFGITGVGWAMLIAVGGASLVWPSIAIWILRPTAGQVWRTLALPVLLAAVSTPSVAVTRLLLAQTPLPDVVRLAAAILAGAAAFGLATLLLRASLQHDLTQLKQSLPEEESITDTPEPLVPSPLPIPTPAPIAVIADS
ncbi:MAG: oligosaccharide flippase family protein [Dehalococcoidia bacterium]